MAQNKISDLRNHLFAQLERLGNEELKKEELMMEVARSKAIVDVASEIVQSAKVECEFINAMNHMSVNQKEVYKNDFLQIGK